MIPHRDEILRPAVSTDATAVPRYNLVRPDGTIIEKNVALRLANPVAQAGTPISKAALDEILAASGVTAGTATAYTLAQDEYTLFDGAPVQFRLHVASEDGATLNVNGTGAKPLHDMMGAALPGGIPAETWLTAYYSAAAGAYVLAGGEAVRALYGERYTVDDAVAYVKDVPGDALPAAEVGEVGGMTYKVNTGTEANPVYELRSAAVAKIESVGVNLFDKSKVVNAYETDTGFVIYNEIEDGAPIDIGSLKTIAPQLKVGDIVTHYGDTVNASIGGGKTFFYLAGVSLDWNSGMLVTITDKMLNSHVFAYGRAGMSCRYNNVIITKVANAPYIPYMLDTLPIPEAVRKLEGHGWGIDDKVHNYIDWKKKQFVKMANKDIWNGTEDNITIEYSRSLFVLYLSDNSFQNEGGSGNKGMCNLYEVCYGIDQNDMPEQSILICPLYITRDTKAVYVKDTRFTTEADFKAHLAEQAANGNPLEIVYELALPIITDISELLPADNLVRVQNGGTITPINEYGYAVPTKITYQRDVLANRASIFALEKLRLAMELLASIDYVDDTVSATIAAAVAPLAKANLSNASGTFGGVVKANASAVSALGTAQVRNVTISNVDLTAGSSALATGDSYRVYS